MRDQERPREAEREKASEESAMKGKEMEIVSALVPLFGGSPRARSRSPTNSTHEYTRTGKVNTRR